MIKSIINMCRPFLSASKCTAYVFRTLRVSSLNDYEYIYVRSKSLARLGAPANGARAVPKNIYCTLKLAYLKMSITTII